ncbi:MAG TPA: hypothetical protein VFJ16_31265 [Longimicrobium sp.]|nr:hypothetical protein [Longimicrobium sp.]
MKRTPLARKAPPKPRARGLQHTAQLAAKPRPAKPRARLRPLNPERRKRLREEQYGPHHQLFHALPCAECFPERYATHRACLETVLAALPRLGWRRSDPAHVKSRGAGGKARHVLPGCFTHHRVIEHGLKRGPADPVGARQRRAERVEVAARLAAVLAIPEPRFDMAAAIYELAGGTPHRFALRVPLVLADLEQKIGDEGWCWERWESCRGEVLEWARHHAPWMLDAPMLGTGAAPCAEVRRWPPRPRSARSCRR